MLEAGRSIIETRSAQMFPELSQREIERLRSFGEPHSYADGERVLATGDISPGLFVILAGEIAVTQRSALGYEESIVTHGPGSFMGELNQLRNRMDAAVEWTVRAIDHSEGLGETVALSSAYQQLGELRSGQGDMAACEACFDRALEILERAGVPERQAECASRRQRALLAKAAAGSRAG